MDKLLQQYLDYRGFSYEELTNSSLKKIPPFLLKDLEKVALRVVQAIQKNEKICIYGDYDVDGICAISLLYHFLKQFKVELFTYQPDRFEEGYGLHEKGILEALNHGCSLFITVDLGINAVDIIAQFSQKIDIIITDHHLQIQEELPSAFAVINPNRKDENCHPFFKDCCAATVVFILSVEINKHFNKTSCYDLLVFVAIATLCDQVQLNPMNLTFVRHGLNLLVNTKFPGLQVFQTDKKISEEFIQFYIGPILNAQGRLDHAKKSLKLLLSESFEEASQLFLELKTKNEERKAIQKTVYSEVVQILDQKKHSSISFAYGDWHEGVLGIVASKIVEKTKKPTFLLRPTEEGFKGSARTFENIHLLDILEKAEHCFLKYGGHKAAAGFLVKKNSLESLESILEHEVSDFLQSGRLFNQSFKILCSLQDLSLEVFSLFESLRPFGQGNPRPIFQIMDFEVQSISFLKEKYPLIKLYKSPLRVFSFNENLSKEHILKSKTMETHLVWNDYSSKIELRPLAFY